ncbi:hypothetical protein Tco_1439539 [Tanacetum coccineum]
MSRSTISYESLAESLADSMGSFVSSVALPYFVPTIDSESEPFEEHELPVASDYDSVEPSLDSDPFVDHASPAISAVSDPDDEPLGSPNTADYYRGSEFSEDDPSEDVSTDAALDTDEPPILPLPAFYPQTSPIFPAPVILPGKEPPVRTPFRTFSLRTRTIQTPRKSVRPQPPLPLPILARVDAWIAAYPSSPPPLPAHLGPSHPASPPAASAPVLPATPVKMLPPRKRFTTLERTETLEREVVTLTARLAAAEIQIDAFKRDVIGRDVRETG